MPTIQTKIKMLSKKSIKDAKSFAEANNHSLINNCHLAYGCLANVSDSLSLKFKTKNINLDKKAFVKFFKDFSSHLLKKCFKKVVEAFQVWVSKENPTRRKFSKCVLRAQKVKNVSNGVYNGFMSCSGHFEKIKRRFGKRV